MIVCPWIKILLSHIDNTSDVRYWMVMPKSTVHPYVHKLCGKMNDHLCCIVLRCVLFRVAWMGAVVCLLYDGEIDKRSKHCRMNDWMRARDSASKFLLQQNAVILPLTSERNSYFEWTQLKQEIYDTIVIIVIVILIFNATVFCVPY